MGPGPLDRSGMGWSCLCLGYKRGVCLGVPSWDILIRESPFLWNGMTWLWSSTVVRTGIWKMIKWFWLLITCLKSSIGVYIELLVNELMMTANKIEYKDARLVMLSVDAITHKSDNLAYPCSLLFSSCRVSLPKYNQVLRVLFPLL